VVPPSPNLPKAAPPHPPGASASVRRLAERAMAPIERFLAIEASSGLVLLGVALLAMVWANSPWRNLYQALWHTPLGLRLGPWAFERDLHFWINDGLMTVFFFVVGLEIRREIFQGELSQLRRAALPLAAAVGGMIAPALLYTAFNFGRPSAVGWGVPMATDIAFAVGVLALLGKRVVPAMRILLLALAVIDDVGAIGVIAAFYSSGIAPAGLVIVAGGVLAIVALQKLGVRNAAAYLLPALVVWAGAYASGIHPTLAGVVVGLMTPVRAWFGVEGFLDEASAHLEQSRTKRDEGGHALLPQLDALNLAGREAVSPVERLLHLLHGPVAFGIMPLFALANAGVQLGSASFEGDGARVFLGIVVGLVVGKPIGILGISWALERIRLVALPTAVRWPQVSLVGMVAGIGFTMALFIAQLAFPPGPLLETAKLAILIGSALAALLAFAGSRFLRPAAAPPGADSDAAAEASTEH
jgi:NhaA family Na+:H+ antiporter